MADESRRFDAKARDRGEAQSPRRTVVGGRPPERADPWQPTPEGIELLLAAASHDDDFRRCLLDDPLAAARRAEVRLLESEQAILRAVPPAQLAAMLDGLALSNPARRRFLRSAATTALTVFAGTALAACGSEPEESLPPIPGPVTVRNGKEMEVVLAEARKGKRGLLIVFRSESIARVLTAGLVYGRRSELEMAGEADRFCREFHDGLVQAALDDRFQVVQYGVPVEWGSDGYEIEDEFALGHRIACFPTVLFLRADGEVLARCIQPTSEPMLREALAEAVAVRDKTPTKPRLFVPGPQFVHTTKEMESVLTEAKAASYAMMVVLLSDSNQPHLVLGHLSDATRRRWESERVCRQPSHEVMDAAEEGHLGVAFFEIENLGGAEGTDRAEEQTRRWKVEEFPTVLYLFPDGTELARYVQPATDEELHATLLDAIKTLATYGH